MVNHGASRGCLTCKKRRKKCDEGRPSCKRCINSNLVCLLNNDKSGTFLFRHFHGLGGTTPIEPSSENAEDFQIDRDGLSAFLNGYCVEPFDRKISRGFLDGFQSLILHAGQDSDVAQAARIVAAAGFGNRTGRPDLVNSTKPMYIDLLRSLRATLSCGVSRDETEPLMTVVLLGLYEMIISNGTDLAKQNAHVGGICAILSSQDSPYDMIKATRCFQLGNALLLDGTRAMCTALLPSKTVPSWPKSARIKQVPGVLCAPVSNGVIQSLDAIFVKVFPVYQRAKAILPNPSTSLEDIERLKQDAMDIDEEMDKWSTSQTGKWDPIQIGTITEEQAQASQYTDCWPGRVEKYLDFYIATVWNTYRKAHLMVLEIIVKCRVRLEENIGRPSNFRELARAQILIDAVVASIPYQLTENADNYLRDIQSGSYAMKPGEPIGGLLVMHALYVVAELSIIPTQLRSYLLGRLAWIGKFMGIGLATLLSKPVCPIPRHNIAEGHILLWAGMLLQEI